MKTYAVVRFTSEGFHCWPDASGKREYLSHSHRHLFHVEAKVEVTHENREIEFQDLRDACISFFGGGDFGALSCEALAATLAQRLKALYAREVVVSVFEDGEMGAEVWLP